MRMCHPAHSNSSPRSLWSYSLLTRRSRSWVRRDRNVQWKITSTGSVSQNMGPWFESLLTLVWSELERSPRCMGTTGDRRITQVKERTGASSVQFIKRHAGPTYAATVFPYAHNLTAVVTRSPVHLGSKITGEYAEQMSAFYKSAWEKQSCTFERSCRIQQGPEDFLISYLRSET